MSIKQPGDHVQRSMSRREFVSSAASGTVVVALGGNLYCLDDELTQDAHGEIREDGRPRVPPGQRVVSELQPMGGLPGDTDPASLRLLIHGEVDQRTELGFDDLLSMKVVEQRLDVHCVTGWSMLGGLWTGVRLEDLAEHAGLKTAAQHVIFEAAHGYTSNVPLDEALAPSVMVAWKLENSPLEPPHGPPVRALIPDLYFWKSAKWLTGIRFVRQDEPGYWESRGYHNHGDPWREERYG
jgi:DMSO/TMAO reductase YedYZ molybdopterin-dependent catalytic subunit